MSGAAFWRSLDDSLHTSTPSRLLLDRRERFLGELPGTHESFGFWPVPDVLPEKVRVTTLETEDRHFFDHGGVWWPSVARAAWQNLRHRRVVSGASTIAMQVARLQHPATRTPWAKLREAAEAALLVRRHGHDAVLRQYLTLAPYGARTHGVVRAAQLYFDKPVEDVSWLQAAFLAALPQQPTRMSPWTPQGYAKAMARARRILRQLHARGVLPDEELHVALTSDLALSKHPSRPVEALHVVMSMARRLPSVDVVQRSTIDLDVQRRVHHALRDNLTSLRALGAGNSAGLVVDLPSGEVLAAVGSVDYFDDTHRGAVDYLNVRRSPGSSLKPFIYGLGLERGLFTLASELPDTAVEFPTANGGLYVPENMSHTFMGPMLLRQALGNSRNIPALRVLSAVGVDAVVDRLSSAGVRGVTYAPEAYGLTLAMGSLHVTPYELAQLYTSLGNGGVTVPLRHFLSQASTEGARTMSADAASLIRQALADGDARRPTFPPGGPMEFDFAVAMKTGTSQGNRDAWATAVSDRLLVLVWVGNHDWRRMHLASGATAAAPAVQRIVRDETWRHRPWVPVPATFSFPASSVRAEVCALSGRVPGPSCPRVKSEVFLPGTEPHEACPFHAPVAIDLRTGLRAGPTCPSSVVQTKHLLALPEVYAPWARQARLTIAPTAESPLCPTTSPTNRFVRIRTPAPASRYLFDPDTAQQHATLHLSAHAQPATEDVVWLVDGAVVARVGYPHEAEWPISRGTHVIRAQLAQGGEASPAVRITIDD